MEAANDTGAVAQPLDEEGARKNIAKMMDTELGINTTHPFQLDAVLALAYKHSSLLFIRAPGDGKSAVVHAAMRLLRDVDIVVDSTLSVEKIKPYLRRRRGYLLFIGAASAQAALQYSSDAPRPQRAARHQACYLRIPRGP